MASGGGEQHLLHLDCFAGASGNMILGALLELGVPVAVIDGGLAALGLVSLRTEVSKVKRGSIAASHVSFEGGGRDSAERSFASIRTLLEEALLGEGVRSRSLEVFTRLAEAEGRVHGVPAGEVHFHELGATDALADIVGVCLALEHLGVERLTASPLALGSGSVESAHGTLPLPAPATIELLRGIPTYPVDVGRETVTPTGAALLATFVERFGPMPPLVPELQGFGAGEERESAPPNVLRAILGRSAPVLEGDVVAVLETNLDDMNPEHLPYLLEELMAEGALDASLSPLAMKKGRPGQLLRVIAEPGDRDRLARRILVESSAIGVRYQEVSRLRLPREVRQVRTRLGEISVKVVRTPDGRRVATPEYEGCARIARERGVPLRQVYREATLAAEEQLE